MATSRNLIKGYQDLTARPATAALTARSRTSTREDRIFQRILPRSRASLGDFALDGAGGWDAEILLEGDFLSPLQA